MGLGAEVEEPVVPPLYEEISRVVSDAVSAAVASRSESPLDPVRVWDGMQAVWLTYETNLTGRSEAHLAVRPADVKMLGMEESADEFLLVVGSRAWHGDDHLPFWSSPERYSRVVDRGVSRDDLSGWVSDSIDGALERASRELRPLRAVGRKATPAKKAAPAKRVAAAAAKKAVPDKQQSVPVKGYAAAATRKATLAKKAAPAKRVAAAAAKKAVPDKQAVPVKKSAAAASKKTLTKKSTTARQRSTTS